MAYSFGEEMSDYDDIMEPLMAGDVTALEEIASIVEGFPSGKDDFVSRHWITNAIDCGTKEVVAWMLSKKVPVVFRDDEGCTVLHSAIDREKPDRFEIIRMLLEAGADINAHGFNDWTPAHQAAVRDDVESLKILVEAGADLSIQTRIDNYATPLEEAEILGKSPNAVAYLRNITEQGMRGNRRQRP
jgi:ankyrin repeat protein